MAITPDPAFSGVGIPLQLKATGTYADATTVDVTALATRTSSAPSIATVAATTGLTTGVALGATTVSASIGSVNATASLSIVANVWSPAGCLSTLHSAHSATPLSNGNVLVAGGYFSSATTASAELFDFASRTWSVTGSLLGRRGLHTATLLPNGKVLVSGGGNRKEG